MVFTSDFIDEDDYLIFLVLHIDGLGHGQIHAQDIYHIVVRVITTIVTNASKCCDTAGRP